MSMGTAVANIARKNFHLFLFSSILSEKKMLWPSSVSQHMKTPQSVELVTSGSCTSIRLLPTEHAALPYKNGMTKLANCTLSLKTETRAEKEEFSRCGAGKEEK